MVPMRRTHNLLFITFVLNRRGQDPDVRCCGCKHIVVLDYKKPTHIKGLIEFEGRTIPVVDPSTWFCGQQTPLTGSTCILVVEHSYDCQPLRTGVLVPEMDEILHLAAGSYVSGALKGTSFNTRFVLDLSRNTSANKFLADSHLALGLCEGKRLMDDDFETFKEIVSRGLIHV